METKYYFFVVVCTFIILKLRMVGWREKKYLIYWSWYECVNSHFISANRIHKIAFFFIWWNHDRGPGGIYDGLDHWTTQLSPTASWVRIIAANRRINTIVPMSGAINKINRTFFKRCNHYSFAIRAMYEKWLSHNLHNSLALQGL